MVGKIRAAVDARRRDETLIIARTDARVAEWFESAVQRALAYREAGADVLFVEASQTEEELFKLPRWIPIPTCGEPRQGGRTPLVSPSWLDEFRIVLFANAALQTSIAGMRRGLAGLRETSFLSEIHDDLADWTERQQLIDKTGFDALKKRYAEKDD